MRAPKNKQNPALLGKDHSRRENNNKIKRFLGKIRCGRQKTSQNIVADTKQMPFPYIIHILYMIHI